MQVYIIIASVAVIVLLLFIIAYSFVRHYTNPRDAPKSLTVVAALSICASLFCVFLIPVDIYTVSSSLNPDGTHIDPDLVKSSALAIKLTYYGLYSLLLALGFAILPFYYFYFEEDDENISEAARTCGALKYTVGFAIVFVVLLVLGVILKTNKGDQSDDWISDLSGQFKAGEALLMFAVGCMAVFGLTGWVSYTAYGLACLPMELASGGDTAHQPLSAADESNLDHLLDVNKKNQNYVSSRYDFTEREWTKQDTVEINRLKQEERKLRDQRDDLTPGLLSGDEGPSCGDRVWTCLAPFRIIIAILLMIVSLSVITALSMATLDKFLHSKCKLSCGYVLEDPTIVNPIDLLLNLLANYFPLDFFFFGAIITYIFVSSTTGLVNLGVRLCFYKLFTIRRKRTMPHALLMGCWMLMFVCLVLNLQVVNLSPQYAMFGNQFYFPVNGTRMGLKTPCTLDQNPLEDICQMTQLGTFTSTLGVQLPFIATIMFFANLVFLLVFLLSLLVRCCNCTKLSRYQKLQQEKDDDLWA